MTKAELVTKISTNLGLEKNEVLATVENFMEEVKNSLSEGENVYLRGFVFSPSKKEIITAFLCFNLLIIEPLLFLIGRGHLKLFAANSF